MTEIPKTPQFTKTTNAFRSKVMQVGSFRTSFCSVFWEHQLGSELRFMIIFVFLYICRSRYWFVIMGAVINDAARKLAS